MKVKKIDFELYVKSGKLSSALYLISSLIILIPISIALGTGFIFSSSFSKISIGIAIVFIMIGKLLAILNKNKGDKSIHVDIGILIGILIVFISHILK